MAERQAVEPNPQYRETAARLSCRGSRRIADDDRQARNAGGIGTTEQWEYGNTQFLDDGDEAVLAAEYDASGTLLRRYLHGPNPDQPLVWYEGATMANPRWLHTDERGSVIAVADTSYNPIIRNSYDEWGVPASTNAGRFQYTGQAWIPELGLYYYKARFYAPTLGRFMQTDPVGYTGGINLYAYVANDPVDGRDPTGLAFGLDDAVGAVGGALVGVAVELGKDALTGEEVTAGGLAGAAAGGALLGEGVVNTPETLGGSLVAAGAARGAVVGFVSNSVQQGTDIASGAQKGYSAKSAAVSTAVGAVTEGIATRVPTTRVGHHVWA